MELQKQIDLKNYVKIKKGVYETAGLFLHSGLTIEFEEGVVLKASLNEDDYKDIKTRVAGINMNWYPALLNVIDCNDVVIRGHAIIDGQGEYWWNKYWGLDKKGGMREEYDKKGLRWACDYDCKRPRGVLIQNSSNVKLYDIESFRSGFWNVHILYSHDVEVKNVKISTLPIESPSTDGIDIDSSYNIVIDSCETDCFDDSICIKSGRDADGLKTNISSHHIEIKNCVIRKGFGITIGSEVSGGVYSVNIHDNKFINTDCGFRIKSARSRKGYIRNIKISSLEMINVKYLFNMVLDWNPNYNAIKLPEGVEMKEEWKPLLDSVDDSIPNTKISSIYIMNVNSTITDDYSGISRVFNIVGFEDSPMENISVSGLNAKAFEYGVIKNADVDVSSSDIKTLGVEMRENDEFDNR